MYSKTESKLAPEKNPFVVVGSDGVFKVENSTEPSDLVLSHLYSVGNQMRVSLVTGLNSGIRTPATNETVSNLEIILFETGVEVADRHLNLAQKISFYSEVAREGGFVGLVRAYLATVIELTQTSDEDNILGAFARKLRVAIVQEMSFVMNRPENECELRLNDLVIMFSGMSQTRS